MDQTVLVFHIIGLAILLQLHMEYYVFRRKKTRKVLAHFNRSGEKITQG